MDYKKYLKFRSVCIAAACAAAVTLAVFVAPVLGSRERDFLVRSFSPQGVVTGAAEIKVLFNHAAVSDDAVGAALAPSAFPFVFSPAVSGSGRWEDASTFVFTPSGGRLSPATRYTASARAELRDREGEALFGTQIFTFSTPALAFRGAKQTDFDPQSGRTVFELEFSLPVSPARLRGYAEVRDGGGQPLNFSINQGPASKKISLTLEALANKQTELHIAAGLPSEAGPLGLEKEARVKLARSLVMALRDSSAESGMDGGRIIIDTTAPVELSKAAAFIEISPASAFTVEPVDGGFAIAGAFKPQDRVKVTIKKGLPSAAGKTLAKEWSRAFIFPDIAPSVRFARPGRVISPADSLRVALEAVNYDKLNIIIWQLYDNNIAYAMRNEWGGYPTDLSRLIANKDYIVRAAPNETARRALDLKPLLGGKKGVFLIVAQGRGNEWSEARQTVNITDLGLTVKAGADSALARVLSVSSAKAVPGTKVTLWSWSNQIVGEGRTDKNGMANITLKDAAEKGAPVIALAEKDKDVSYVRLENGLYNGNDDFDTSGMPWLRGYSAFCYAPRDIFRPGESVPLFAVVRGKDGKAPAPFPLTMKVYSPSGKLWKSHSAKLSQEGSFAASVNIPADAPTGPWHVALCVPGDDSPIGYKDIYIEEFAAPRLFVETAAKPAALTGNGRAQISVSARYTFGNPAAGMRWETELRTIDRTFAHKNWKSFSFRDEEKKFVPENSFLASGTLNGAGAAKTELSGGSWSAPSMLDLSVRAGVMDDGGRWTYKTLTIPWYPSAVMAGVEAPREARPNRPVAFRAAAVKTDGKPADVKEMKYSLFRRVRQSVLFESEGRMSRRTQEQLIPRAQGVIKLTAGAGSASASLKEAGEYLLRVETPDGKSRASASIFAYGKGGAEGQYAPEMTEITTDKKIYKVGETAKVKIKAPFEGAALLDAETTSSVWSESRAIKGKEAEFSVKVTEAMRPNAWLTAQVVRPAQKDGAPARAFGVTPLLVDNSQNRLLVTFDKKPKIEPGKNEISLTVKDAAGKGVTADVTVMLVDETVLGLTGYKRPDPWNWFTGRRQLGMETYDLYGALITPESGATPLLTAGGGGMADNMMMKSSLSPVQAQRFKMLSITKRTRTDAYGKCAVTMDVPEFSGKARLTAVAATAQAEGAGDAAVQINRDIVTEPSLPRFAAPGDKFEAPCRLFNMTDKPLTVKLTVESAPGEARLAAQKGGARTVTIKGKEAAVIPLSFEAHGIGTAKISYTVSWGAQKNASAKTVIELPIRPAAPRVFESGSTVLKPGAKWRFAAPEPGKRGPENFAESVVMLSAMPQVSLARLAGFLVTYPYGCFEQTVSSAWPLLVQPELVKYVDPALADKAALASRIAKIESLQNYDGGFPRWSGENTSQPWESLYGAHFLLEAARMGHKVSPDARRAAVDYARALLPVMPDSDTDAAWRETLTRRAYAAFVLALAKEAPLGWMESLHEKIGQMDSSGRLLLAAAYAAAGEKKEAAAILGKKAPAMKDIPGKNVNYDSKLRSDALSLLARTYIDPAGAEAAAAAAELLSKIKASAVYNTQEGGFAMAALGRWFAAQPREGAPAGILMREPAQKNVGSVTAKNRTVVTTEPGSYLADNNGSARLYAAWSASYIPTRAVPQKDDGIEIRQRIVERGGKPLGKETVRGASLTATVTITPKAGALRGVVAVVPLAAGFEIENPRLTGANEDTPRGVRSEIRDDRLILFIDELKSPLVWRYSLRAVTEGRFAFPQISAECMYDPGISSISGGGTIKVNAAK
ncbi:MAG: MG2 domain-containing protein [Cloacibacillus sp.]